MKKRLGQNWFWVAAALAAALGMAWLLHDGLYWADFGGQWQICAYTNRGVNPYTQIGAAAPADAGIGAIPPGWSTSPWGCLLGNLFYAGFLPQEAAKIWFLVMGGLVLAATAWSFYRRVDWRDHGARWPLLAVPLLSLDYLYAIDQGNCGGMLCGLVLLALLWRDRAWIAGICLAVAMIKPQVALPFCLCLLLDRRYRLLCVAAALDIAAWIAAAWMTGTGVLRLLAAFFGAGSGLGAQFRGVCTLLGRWIPNDTVVLACSMCVGMAYVLLLTHAFCKARRTGALWFFVPACIASTVWCYSFLNDNFVMVLPSLMCLWLAFNQNTTAKSRVVWMAAFGYCYFGRLIRSVFNLLLERLPLGGIAWHYGETVYQLGLLLVGAVLVKAYLSFAAQRAPIDTLSH